MTTNRPTGGMYQPYIYNQHITVKRGGYSITGRGWGWIIYRRIISIGRGSLLGTRRLFNVITTSCDQWIDGTLKMYNLIRPGLDYENIIYFIKSLSRVLF